MEPGKQGRPYVLGVRTTVSQAELIKIIQGDSDTPKALRTAPRGRVSLRAQANLDLREATYTKLPESFYLITTKTSVVGVPEWRRVHGDC